MDVCILVENTGQKFCLDFNEGATVLDAKRAAAERLKLKGIGSGEDGAHNLKLSHGDTLLLDDTATLSGAGIRAGDELSALIATHSRKRRTSRFKSPHGSTVTCMAASACGSHLYTAGPRGIRIWDAHTGDTLLDIPFAEAWAVKQMLVCPTGDRLYVVRYEPKRGTTCCVEYHDIAGFRKGRRPFEIQKVMSEYVAGIAVSPCGGRLYIATSSDRVRVWDARGHTFVESVGEAVNGMPALLGITAMAASPCGDTLYCIGWHKELVAVCTTSWRILQRRPLDRDVKMLCVSHGKLYCSLERCGSVLVWDAATLQHLGSLECGALSELPRQHAGVRLAVSPCGRWVFCSGCGVSVWDARSFTCVGVFHNEALLTGQCLAVTWDAIYTAMGKKVAVQDRRGMPHLTPCFSQEFDDKPGCVACTIS